MSRGQRKAVSLPGLRKPTLLPCFLVRVRLEGWGGIPRGMRHLLRQRVPLETWGTVWCQLCILWPVLAHIIFGKFFFGGEESRTHFALVPTIPSCLSSCIHKSNWPG